MQNIVLHDTANITAETIYVMTSVFVAARVVTGTCRVVLQCATRTVLLHLLVYVETLSVFIPLTLTKAMHYYTYYVA